MKTIALIFIGILFFTTARTQNQKIVFVCEHGSAKSMIAMAYFNKAAKKKNLPWEAISRGTNPDEEISPKTRELLERDHILNKNLKPQKLSQADVNGAEQVIMFYELPTDIRVKSNTQYWVGINVVNGDYQKLRDEIVHKVVNPLIDSLTKR